MLLTTAVDVSERKIDVASGMMNAREFGHHLMMLGSLLCFIK
jgi:hypothetical protein